MQKKYTDEQIEKAKQLYLRYGGTRKQICDVSGLSFDSLKYYISTYWHKERELRKNEVIKAMTESKKALISAVSKHGFEILEKGLEKLNYSDKPMTPGDLVKIAGVISEMDKITRLDEGNPTDILANVKPATIVEVQEVLKNDPFFDNSHALPDIIESTSTGDSPTEEE